MAQMNLFHYIPGAGPLHRMDARFKLPALILACTAAFSVTPAGLLPAACFAAILWIASRLKPSVFTGGLKGIAALVLLIVIGLALTTPGEPFLIRWISGKGIEAGVILSVRMILLVIFGTLFVATTVLSELQAAIVWYLSPFPFLRGPRIAITVSLVIRLIPLIAEEYGEIRRAVLSRCLYNSRNPVRRIVRTSVPILIRTMERGEELVRAMESRCFTEERSFRKLRSSGTDWFLLVPGAGIPILLLAIFR